jgi:hypothetical protein
LREAFAHTGLAFSITDKRVRRFIENPISPKDRECALVVKA